LDEIIAGIGAKVHLLRQGAGLSLQQLAERSGVSAAAIHKIERNAMVPTVTTLMRLAQALGRSVGYFVEEDRDEASPVVLVRANDRATLLPSRGGLTRQNLAGPLGRFALSASIVTIPPGRDSGRAPLVQPGEELVYLVSGSMEFEVDATYRLRRGDSLHLRTEHPHRWRNTSARPAKAVWISLRVPPPR
jgi:transcriptional regulator with XRE-family HTH domain